MKKIKISIRPNWKKWIGLWFTLIVMMAWTVLGSLMTNLSTYLILIISSIFALPWNAYWAAKDYGKMIRNK